MVTLPSTLIGTQSYSKVHLSNASDQAVHFDWTLEKHLQCIILQPMSGIMNPKTQREVIISFSPENDAFIKTTALCNVTGKMDALKLEINGRGKGSDIEFSFKNLETGRILVTTPYTTELILHNKSEIEAVYSARSKSEFISISPFEGVINAGGYQSLIITVLSMKLGYFEEKIEFEFVGSSRITSVIIRFGKNIFMKNLFF